MAKKNSDNLLVSTPAWVLKSKVDNDWNEWRFMNAPNEEEGEEDDDLITEFPEYDSTIKCLELLSNNGIKFNKKNGKWSDEV